VQSPSWEANWFAVSQKQVTYKRRSVTLATVNVVSVRACFRVCLGLNGREISEYLNKVRLFKGRLCLTSSTFHHCRHWRQVTLSQKSPVILNFIRTQPSGKSFTGPDALTRGYGPPTDRQFRLPTWHDTRTNIPTRLRSFMLLN